MKDLIDFNLNAYNYELEPQLIAQIPTKVRHEARLMIVRGKTKKQDKMNNLKVWDIQEELQSGDLLVVNDTRVIKARLTVRLSGGGKAELFVLEPLKEGRWLCLARPARKLRSGDYLLLEANEQESIKLKVISKDSSSGGRVIQFPSNYFDRKSIEDLLDRYGKVPLPPYIKNTSSSDKERYQTLFASQPGAVAAPTAGLHLSDELLQSLHQKGVVKATITLHVGLGTFKPLDQEDLTDLQLHSEWVEVSNELVLAVEKCRSRGGRVIAVGTTCVRALEAAFQLGGKCLEPMKGKVELVIKPGYQFGVVDGLLTNFHLPKSSLLLLVSALIGRERLLALYKKAIKSKYRFFSYGDAMFITPEAVLDSARVQSQLGC